MHYILLITAVMLVLIISAALITGRFENDLITRNFYVLGTVVQLKVFGKKAEKAVDEVINRLNDIDDKMSVFKNFSEISIINDNAGKSMISVSDDTYKVIKSAVKYSKLSEGMYDPTVGPLVNLWGIGTDNAAIPNDSEINKKLKMVNYKDILFDDDTFSVMLAQEGQSFDAGGIAKGYAADEVNKILKKNHIKSAVINLGGNIFVLGSKVNNKNELWKVGIQNPFDYRGNHVGVINIKNKSIVTSGNYERYFEYEGKRYHHIIDPKTGYPSESKIVSATIISDKSIDGDGLSTGVYIMGLQKAFKLIESLKGIDAIFITNDKKIYCTFGIKDNFKLENYEFIQCDTI
ncbi:MAG: FAD:protein FMN transferase [Bacillota bacterium]|nr:FAD:protein FMN transferase [Bacillota bacterium]